MPIIPFNLQHVATNIAQVTCLYDPESPFQFGKDSSGNFYILPGNELNRDVTVASAGYLSSIDTFTTPTTANPGPAIGVFPIPANAFAVNFPSSVYGVGSIPNDNSFSVIQINTVLAAIEPGFSRIRVDYVDDSATARTEYFDCPFYEGWDVTARELNNIVAYMQNAIYLLQREIDNLRIELQYVQSREFWRGLSVSGQVQVTPATEGLITGPFTSGSFPHDMLDKTAPTVNNLPPAGVNPAKNYVKPIDFVNAVYADGYRGSSSGPKNLRLALDSNNNANHIFGWAGQDAHLGGVTVNENNDNNGWVSYYMAQAIDAAGNPCVVFMAYMGAWVFQMMEYGLVFFKFPSNITFDRNASVLQNDGNANNVLGLGAGSGDSYLASIVGGTTANPVLTPTGSGLIFNVDNGADSTHLAGGFGFLGVAKANGTNSSNALVNTGNTSFIPGYWDFVDVPFNNAGNQSPVSSTPMIRSVWYPASNSNSIPAPSIQTYGYHYDQSNPSLNSFVRGASWGQGTTWPQNVLNINPIFAAPSISTVNPSIACVGNTVTLTGTNFSNAYGVYINQLGTPVQNLQYPDSRTCTFTVPPGVTVGPATILMSNISSQVTATFTINPSPQIASVFNNDSSQSNEGAETELITISGTNFGAVQGEGTLSLGSHFLTPDSWTNTAITFNIPLSSVIAGGTYPLTVTQGCGSDTRQFIVDARLPVGGPPQIVITPNSANLTNGQGRQFVAYVVEAGKQAFEVTNTASWYVNNVLGGESTDGTITAGGLFVAPTNITGDSTSTVKASVVFEDLTDGGNPYNGTTLNSTVSVNLAPPDTSTSPVATVTVTSQLNIFLGDGRAGYVPVNTTVDAFPGDYIYTQFVERIDSSTQIPVASNSDIQQLSLKTKSALDADIASEMYNLAGQVIDSVNNQVVTKRTVLLGIIDPSDGYWHSMWDIGLSPTVLTSSEAHSMPKALAYYADTLPAFSPGHEYTGSVMDYIDNITGINQKQISSIAKKNNELLVGNCYFDDSTKEFEVIDGLNLLVANDVGQYKSALHVEKQTINVPHGNYLYIYDNELKTGRMGDVLPNSAVLIGVSLDRFYTKWPILPQYFFTADTEDGTA